MRVFDEIRKVLAKFAGSIAASRELSHFNCGDCEQNEQCGLPPSDKCIVKIIQIARDNENHARPPAGFYIAVWPN